MRVVEGLVRVDDQNGFDPNVASVPWPSRLSLRAKQISSIQDVAIYSH